ncbi:MAG: efflux RND transporter permease subunit [Planctomycetota bacterium]
MNDNDTKPLEVASLFFDNRRLLLLALLLILVAGLSSFYVLPRMEDPVLTQRVAIINTLYPGAGAERVEALITEKIEEELQEIEEIKELRSSSRAGISTITIELKDSVYEVDEVWSRVRDKMDDASILLPPEALEPDFDLLEVTAYASIVSLVWELPGEANYAVLRRLAEALEDAMRAVPGTREVDTYGDPSEEVTVVVQQDELASLGLTAADVAAQIAASDAKVSAGQLRTPDGSFIMEVDTELETLERIRAIPINYGSDGRFVRLADLAEVKKTILDPPRSVAVVDGQPAIALGALVREEKRVDLWAADFDAAVREFESELPQGVRLARLFEQNEYVADRLSTLLGNLIAGASAVVFVIWLMMGWRSALVVGSALPLAALMVLAGMRFMGIPMHQMSITGLIIALGLLIDNAIVMVDEVRERISDGEERRHAVAGAVKHLAIPLLGSTVTTALSFAPIALMPGPAGEFVGSIAVSVILAVASSFALAMTITPTLIAIFSGGAAAARPRRWWRDGYSNSRLTRVYRAALGFTFRHPVVGVLLGMVLPVTGFILAGTLTEQFFPPSDRNQFQVQMTLPSQSSIGLTERTAMRARDLMLQHELVESVQWFIGESAPPFYYNMLANREGTPQYAQALVQIGRAGDAEGVIRELQALLDQSLPEAQTLVRQLEQGPPFEAPVEVRLYGPDLQVLQELGDEVRRVLSETPDVLHTTANLAEALPKLAVQIDEQQARLAGMDHRSVARQLDTTLEGATGGSILEETEELTVRVREANERRADLSQVASLDLLPPGSTGLEQSTPLSSLADVALVPEISVVPHFNTQRMNEVQAYITAGVLPAQVLADFQQRLAAAGFEVPPGYSFEYGGEASKRDDAVGNLLSSVAVLMVMMAATLVLSFGSFRMAGLVAMVGALSVGLSLGALAVFGYPFGFMAIVGTMGLVGVAINDTIVVLAALREDRLAREGDPDAVRDVVVRATRHVVATTLTTIAGFMPLLLGGGGFWPPLATTIAGGVAGATILALFFAPSCYVLLMCRGRHASGGSEAEPVGASAERELVAV